MIATFTSHFNRKNTCKYLAAPRVDIFSVEMTSFMFLSQQRDTQAIFYLLNKFLYKVTADEVLNSKFSTIIT